MVEATSTPAAKLTQEQIDAILASASQTISNLNSTIDDTSKVKEELKSHESFVPQVQRLSDEYDQKHKFLTTSLVNRMGYVFVEKAPPKAASTNAQKASKTGPKAKHN